MNSGRALRFRFVKTLPSSPAFAAGWSRSLAEVITGFRYSSGNVAGWQQDLQVASVVEYIPAKDFWSIVVYDNQTRSMLQTDQRLPAVGSQKGAVANPDTSVDVYFGPTAPAGHEANWVQTIPGKGWNVLLRLYGPLQPWYDKTWRPGEIELTK